MASSWGNSWGSSWGNSWGVTSTPPAPAPSTERPGGGSPPRFRKRRSGKVIRYSDFESRDDYEKALLAAASPLIVPMPEIQEADEGEADDEALLKALIVTMIH